MRFLLYPLTLAKLDSWFIYKFKFLSCWIIL